MGQAPLPGDPRPVPMTSIAQHIVTVRQSVKPKVITVQLLSRWVFLVYVVAEPYFAPNISNGLV